MHLQKHYMDTTQTNIKVVLSVKYLLHSQVHAKTMMCSYIFEVVVKLEARKKNNSKYLQGYV